MNSLPHSKVVSRIIDRFFKNQYLAAGIVLMLIMVVFYRDVVFEKRTFLIETVVAGTMPDPPGGPYNYTGIQPGFVASDPGAIAWQTEPFTRLISKLIKRGDFPLWNPYTGLAGSPLFADGYTAPLEPIQFLFFFVPDRYWPLATDIQLLIRFFIAGFSCYMFARRQNIGPIGSICSASLFMLSSYFVAHGNHPQIKTEMLLPLVLYGYDRLADPEDKQGPWICALVIGWAIISGMPESTFFALLLGTLWYLYKSLYGRQAVFGKTRNILIRFTFFSVIGILISAVFLLPFLEFVLLAKTTHTASSVLVNYPEGTGNMVHPLWHLPILLFQVKRSFFLQLGFFSLFVLVYSLLKLKDWTRYHSQIIFFSIYCIVFSLLKFDLPIADWVRSFPVFNLINLSKYPSLSIVFCLAILTGFFIESLEKHPLSYKKISQALVIILVFFIALPVFGNPEKSFLMYFSDVKVMYSSLGVIAGISIALYLLAFFRNREVNYLFIQMGFLILVICEPFYWGAKIIRPNRIDPFQPPSFVQFLQSDQKLFRIFGLDSILYPNISTAYQIADIRWMNALLPQRAGDFTSKFIHSSGELKTTRFTGRFFPISDQMFDILNVKYVLVKTPKEKDIDGCPPIPGRSVAGESQLYFEESTLDDLILQQNPDNKNISEQRLGINDVAKPSIFAHPPQTFDLILSVPRSPSRLEFFIGLNPEVFEADKGDGVNFSIAFANGDDEFQVFSKYIDPKNNPCDRIWVNGVIPLDEWAGRKITIKFITDGGPISDLSWDWAYWGDIRLITSSKLNEDEKEATSTNHYNLVHEDQDIQIYQNENVLPRAFLVYDIVNVSSFDGAMDSLSNLKLDTHRIAVVENLPNELANTINGENQPMQPVAGNAKLLSSGELNVEVNTKSPGLLVVTDQYYPGWQAYIDGEPTPIYAVDGIFRGVFLEEGVHKIEFKYRPLSFIIGALVSIGSLLITISFLYKTQRSKNF